MEWRRIVLLPLAVAVAACSMDGGSSGTGITTVQGNVVSVQPALRTVLEAIQVNVEGTSAADETDAHGRFTVRGRFEGRVHLRFAQPDGGVLAQLEVNVPAGGTLTLSNLQIDGQRGEARPESQRVVFDALIAGTDCPALTVSLVSQHSPDGDTYTLDLAGSSLHDPRGNPVACTDLQEGERLSVHGAVNDDGTFGSADIRVDDAASARAQSGGQSQSGLSA